MNKPLLSQAFEHNGNTAYNFYYEKAGFGMVEEQKQDIDQGSVAMVTFPDNEELSTMYLGDVSSDLIRPAHVQDFIMKALIANEENF